MSYRGALGAPSALLDHWIWTRMQKIWPLEVLGLIVQNKKQSSNIFSIYVQAMKISSTNTFALTHVTNLPYHQTISCLN